MTEVKIKLTQVMCCMFGCVLAALKSRFFDRAIFSIPTALHFSSWTFILVSHNLGMIESKVIRRVLKSRRSED